MQLSTIFLACCYQAMDYCFFQNYASKKIEGRSSCSEDLSGQHNYNRIQQILPYFCIRIRKIQSTF